MVKFHSFSYGNQCPEKRHQYSYCCFFPRSFHFWVYFLVFVVARLIYSPFCYCTDGSRGFMAIKTSDNVETLLRLDKTGFPVGWVDKSILARQSIKGKPDRMIVLTRGTNFELLPLYEQLQQKVLISGKSKAWVFVNYIRQNSEDNVPELRYKQQFSFDRGLVFRPFKDLPEGADYCWILKNKTKLHLLTFDMRVNNKLQFLPVVTGFFDETADIEEHIGNGDSHVNGHYIGNEDYAPNESIIETFAMGKGLSLADQMAIEKRYNRKRATAETLAREVDAIAAINGTFYSTGRNYGKPLGNVIVGGEVAYDVVDSRILQMNRSFIAFTLKGRAVIGETDLPSSLILSANRDDEFCIDDFVSGDDSAGNGFEKGERILSMIGGFGWLVRRGDSKGWLGGVERQFGAEYYGKGVRRPQTIIGVSRSGWQVFFLAQEGYPHSLHRYSLPELAEIAANLGAWNAVFADGGGSTEMVVKGRAVVRTEGLIKPRQISTALTVIR